MTRQSFPSGGFTSNEGAFTLGGGVRINAGDRLTIGRRTHKLKTPLSRNSTPRLKGPGIISV